MGKYDEIINSERPQDPKHPKMSISNRAAQFAPFDALTGLTSRMLEVARITESRIELSDEAKAKIDSKLQFIASKLAAYERGTSRLEDSALPEVKITYFLPDKRKDGGSYENITAYVIKIDTYSETIKLRPISADLEDVSSKPEDEANNDIITIAFGDIKDISSRLFQD